MERQEYIDAVISRPAAQAWQADAPEKKKAVEASIDIALNRVLTAFDFPFVVDNASGTTEANVADYVLKGNNSNARDIISIRFGSDNNLMDEKSLLEHDDWMSGQSTTPSTTGYWVQIGEQQGFPLIHFVGTPSGETTFNYRYRIKELDIANFPKVWHGVIIALIESELFGSAGVASSEKQFRSANPALFVEIADRRLAQMIDDYSKHGGDVDQNYPTDLRWRKKNRRRNAMFGY